MARVRRRALSRDARWHRAIVALFLVAVALVALPSAGAASSGASAAATGLELFVHPGLGGGWSSHAIAGVTAGASTPSVAGSKSGTVLIAQRSASGDVTVAEGSMFGAFSSMDLSSALSAPLAAGRPTAWISAGGAGSVWYRSALGDLIVASQALQGGAWTVTDVTTSIGAPSLAGDPTVVAVGATGVAAYAITALGTIARFAPPTTAMPVWTEDDPTNGLSIAPPLTGNLAVFRAPDLPQATVLLAASQSGDLMELSDELAGPPAAVGPWQVADLTALGAPAVTGPISALDKAGASVASYATSGGEVVALTLLSGLSTASHGGFTTVDLTTGSDLVGSAQAEPSVVDAPGGPSVLERTMTGDLLLASVATAASVADLSFEPHTAELVASDAGAARVGDALVVVAADGGPIAATPLERRIALIATGFDQQHRGFQTTPFGSDCNPFTASFGRGSSSGCPPRNAAEEWCSDFAQYVWRSAGVPTSGITGWSATFVTWGAAHHRVQLGTHFKARVGDAIVWGTRAPLYGTHVAIIVSVLGRYIDVVSGNSGGDFPHYGVGVWRWGAFIGSTSTVNGYKVLGVVQP